MTASERRVLMTNLVAEANDLALLMIARAYAVLGELDH